MTSGFDARETQPTPFMMATPAMAKIPASVVSVCSSVLSAASTEFFETHGSSLGKRKESPAVRFEAVDEPTVPEPRAHDRLPLIVREKGQEPLFDSKTLECMQRAEFRSGEIPTKCRFCGVEAAEGAPDLPADLFMSPYVLFKHRQGNAWKPVECENTCSEAFPCGQNDCGRVEVACRACMVEICEKYVNLGTERVQTRDGGMTQAIFDRQREKRSVSTCLAVSRVRQVVKETQRNEERMDTRAKRIRRSQPTSDFKKVYSSARRDVVDGIRFRRSIMAKTIESCEFPMTRTVFRATGIVGASGLRSLFARHSFCGSCMKPVCWLGAASTDPFVLGVPFVPAAESAARGVRFPPWRSPCGDEEDRRLDCMFRSTRAWDQDRVWQRSACDYQMVESECDAAEMTARARSDLRTQLPHPRFWPFRLVSKFVPRNTRIEHEDVTMMCDMCKQVLEQQDATRCLRGSDVADDEIGLAQFWSEVHGIQHLESVSQPSHSQCIGQTMITREALLSPSGMLRDWSKRRFFKRSSSSSSFDASTFADACIAAGDSIRRSVASGVAIHWGCPRSCPLSPCSAFEDRLASDDGRLILGWIEDPSKAQWITRVESWMMRVWPSGSEDHSQQDRSVVDTDVRLAMVTKAIDTSKKHVRDFADTFYRAERVFCEERSVLSASTTVDGQQVKSVSTVRKHSLMSNASRQCPIGTDASANERMHFEIDFPQFIEALNAGDFAFESLNFMVLNRVPFEIDQSIRHERRLFPRTCAILFDGSKPLPWVRAMDSICRAPRAVKMFRELGSKLNQ